MKRFQKILVPLSLDQSDEKVLYWVEQILQLAEGKEVKFVHVVPDFVYETNGDSDQVPSQKALHKMVKKEALEHISQYSDIPSHIEVTTDCFFGNPDKAILSELVANDYDLVVLAAESEEEHQLAEKMARKAPTSVLMVPSSAKRELKKILVPTDLSEQSAYAIELGQAFARSFQLEQIDCLHAYSVPRDYYRAMICKTDFRTWLENLANHQLNRFLTEHRVEDIKNIPVLIEDKFPFLAINHQIREGEYDMVVIASRGKTALTEFLMGSNATAVVRDSEILTLVVKRKGTGLGLLRSLLGLKPSGE